MQMPISVSRNWDFHNSNTLIYRAQLFLPREKKKPIWKSVYSKLFQLWGRLIWSRKSWDMTQEKCWKGNVVDRLPLMGNGKHNHCFRALLWNSHWSLQSLFQDSRKILEGSNFLFSRVFIRRYSFKFQHSNKQAGRQS